MGRAWTQITAADPTLIEVLGADLLWSSPGGTWVWSGAGGGAGWTNITSAVPTEIVSTGAGEVAEPARPSQRGPVRSRGLSTLRVQSERA